MKNGVFLILSILLLLLISGCSAQPSDEEIRQAAIALLTEQASAGQPVVPASDTPAPSNTVEESSSGGVVVEAETPTSSEAAGPSQVNGPAAEIQDINWYETGSYLYFIGIVENTGSVDLSFVQVHITLRGSDGIMVSSESSYSDRDVIPVGEASPFSIIFSEKPDWSTYDTNIEERENTFYEVYDEFEIVSVKGEVPSYGDYEIVGEIRNTGDAGAEFVQIIAVLFDSNNHIIGLDRTYSDFDIVEAGGTSPFSMTFLTIAEGEIDHFELYIEGREAD